MENRDLQKRRSMRRRQRIEQQKRRKRRRIIFLMGLILLLIFLVYGLYKIFNRQKDISPQTDANQIELGQEKADPEESDPKTPEQDADLSLEVKESEEEDFSPSPIDTKITPQMRKANLIERINAFIAEEELSKEDFNIAYLNLDNNERVELNGEEMLDMGRTSDFILAILAYDLAEEGKLDLDAPIVLENQDNEMTQGGNQEQEDQNQVNPDQPGQVETHSLRYFIADMLQNANDQARSQLVSEVESAASKYWYDAANAKYNIDLTYTNKIKADSVLGMLARLFEREKSDLDERINQNEPEKQTYKYQELMSFMRMNRAGASISAEMIAKGNFGQLASTSYTSTIRLGYVLANYDYVFYISGPSDQADKLEGLFKQLNEWHQYYYN